MFKVFLHILMGLILLPSCSLIKKAGCMKNTWHLDSNQVFSNLEKKAFPEKIEVQRCGSSNGFIHLHFENRNFEKEYPIRFNASTSFEKIYEPRREGETLVSAFKETAKITSAPNTLEIVLKWSAPETHSPVQWEKLGQYKFRFERALLTFTKIHGLPPNNLTMKAKYLLRQPTSPQD